MSFNELKQCRYGTFIYNLNDWPIGTSLRNYGEYAWAELKFLSQFIKPSDLVVDAGANIGTHTLYFSQLVGDKGCVIAFEPQRISFQTLCANVALNSCLNVHAYHAALGKACGEIIVPVRDQNMPNNFGGVPLAGITEGEITPLLTIDHLNLRSCALIKADVEGMEAEVLTGAASTIAKFRPFLYMEADGAQAKEAIQMLFDMGYHCYWSLPTLFNPFNYAKKTEDLFLTDSGDTICSVNMLCVPAEKLVNVAGLKQILSPDEKPCMTITLEECDFV